MQLSAGQFGGERSLRGASGDADGIAIPDIGQLVLRQAHVRSLGELRRAQLHRQHPQSLHDIRGPVSSKLIFHRRLRLSLSDIRRVFESSHGPGASGSRENRNRLVD